MWPVRMRCRGGAATLSSFCRGLSEEKPGRRWESNYLKLMDWLTGVVVFTLGVWTGWPTRERGMLQLAFPSPRGSDTFCTFHLIPKKDPEFPIFHLATSCPTASHIFQSVCLPEIHMNA
jgi:hypothetical protein